MSPVLVVTGMHRSGTSLVANYLQRAGIDMGAELLPADVGNPHGYYEDVVIHDLHREILGKAGIADGFTVRDSDVPVAVDEGLRDRAREIASRREGVWGWKEPRTALLCDMWFELLDDPTFVFLFRHPLGVLDSLLRRAAQPAITEEPVLGLVTWRNYNSEMVRFARAHPDVCRFLETSAFVAAPEDLISWLRSRGFVLDDVPVGDVLVDEAFHGDVRMRTRLLARRKGAETKACERLYDELRSLAAA